MRLTDEQASMLAGEHGEVAQRCMRLLARLGEIYGAERMVPVRSVQVSGVSYKSIGPPGLAFVEDFARHGARVQVPTSLNPAGVDLEQHLELGFDRDFVRLQTRVLDAYRSMGIRPSATCTPYLLPDFDAPEPGDHLAWAESSAVAFANSVLGARTNREGGPSSLAAAICGCTPCYGLHLDKHRRPALVVRVEVALRSLADFGALGAFVGRIAEHRVVAFTGIERASRDQLKALGAAMAAFGAVALFHVAGLTPEADQPLDGLRVQPFGPAELERTHQRLGSARTPEMLIFGCPHASLEEIEGIAGLLHGRRLRVPLWVCTARAVRALAAERGWLSTIERAGGRIVADTCMVVAPIEGIGFAAAGIDSGKAACYMPTFCKKDVHYGSREALIAEALR